MHRTDIVDTRLERLTECGDCGQHLTASGLQLCNKCKKSCSLQMCRWQPAISDALNTTKIMKNDITCAAHGQCQRAAQITSPFLFCIKSTDQVFSRVVMLLYVHVTPDVNRICSVQWWNLFQSHQASLLNT